MPLDTTAAIENGVKKIAVLRCNGVGDFVFALPALSALRRAYPRSEIVLLGRKWHTGFLAGRPGPVDRVVEVPASRGVNDGPGCNEDAAELERFFQAMAEERFDLAIQLHGGGRYSNPFLLRLGARLSAGMKTPDAAPLDRWIPYYHFQPEVFRYLEVVALVGAPPVEIEPRLALTEDDLAEAAAVVPEQHAPLALIHPGATDPRRRWPPEKFAAVADSLAAAGACVLVHGSEAERELAGAVLGAMKAEAIDLAGCLSLKGLAGLLSRCRVVLANDSGPLHLAAAVGAATAGIFWFGNLINAGAMTRGRHRPAISWRVNCPVCDRNTLLDNCAHQESFVADVPIREVRDSALDLFCSPRPPLML